MKKLLLSLLFALSVKAFAQNCDCKKEFHYIRNFIEQNYAGFADKQRAMTAAGYQKIVKRYDALATGIGTKENCLLAISQFLDEFKDHHIQIGAAFDGTKYDSAYMASRTPLRIDEARLSGLKAASGFEGIYQTYFDTTYTIAVVKDKTPLHDYVAVIVDSKLPYWKKGTIKWEGKAVDDSLLKGVLYMRNHRPKVEWFYLFKNQIGGDWQRIGTQRERATEPYQPVAARRLSDKTLYLKISSFSPSNAKNIDSLFKAHEAELKILPYLILDLRDNGGGSDFSYAPIVPYLYTNPLKNIGVDVLSTEATIAGWKALLTDKEIPEATKNSIRTMVQKMEANKGKRVNIVDDETDSSFQPLPCPKKIAVLINKGCASTTEQFLLDALQSKKVILAGEPTDGTLDYSNMREASFSCLPYTLMYATTRSRRLDAGQGIDGTGIKPQVTLKKGTDWIQAAQRLLEK